MRTTIMSLVLVGATAAIMSAPVSAQQKTIKEQLVGTWNLATWEQTYPDGRKDQAFSATPKGVNMFSPDGRFALIYLRSDIPKIASNDRIKMTPQEAMAVAVGSIGYFGTYTVNEQEKSLDLKLEGTSYTNQLRLPQKRIITMISADELKYRNPSSTSGGNIEVTFKRAK